MPLHHRRRRLAGVAEQQAAGEAFWSDVFSELSRVRIQHLQQNVSSHFSAFATTARQLILEDEGLTYLHTSDSASADDNSAYLKTDDYIAYLMNCSDDMMPTVIEAFYEALRDRKLAEQGHVGLANEFVADVNKILLEERVAWEFVNGEMVALGSR